ncbi:NADPH-dependent assimilatory sulfite reductase hemoprotein subunit [bacterium]|jgi:sulfite reductase (ferredoxin)|nr:NADPH-dependent assimilatory sulfite reductase hemoprotein subunit [bacterium]MBT3850739.1 NADPH-dependent assimilatory sulfite reductase hemoprotein subunit [bacterium]MDG2445439.1 NADPH-dependent assimilatory sulfite reductase hemoprotein subunit [Thermodesulfobacteriota bacterium]
MKEVKKVKNEGIKETSDGLRGTVTNELENIEVKKFSPDNEQVLKFHGIYQQEDRDKKKDIIRNRQEREYSFMIRTKNPGGGNITPHQWEEMDKMTEKWANPTLRITTRECFQFHGIGKQNLKNLINDLNKNLISTYGACGDIVRNTVASPISDIRNDYNFDAQSLARRIDQATLAKSRGYYEIWIDGEKVTTKVNRDKIEEDDLYGENYLPRKFKIGVGHQLDNSIDIYTQDIGIMPIVKKDSVIFNVLVGGGLGSHHRQSQTFPRLADELGSCAEEDIIKVTKGIISIQKDYGIRTNRKRARMKYLLEDWGINKFKEELESRLDFELDDYIKTSPSQIDDFYGWHKQKDKDKYYCGIFVENGRIKDTDSVKLKSGLAKIISTFNIESRLTATQDLILVNIKEENITKISEMLAEYNIDTHKKYSELRKASMACPALPTCSLAIAEAERFLPSLIDDLDKRGYGNEKIKIRMSGCPNSCSRPPVSEIGLIGASLNKYNIYLGGDFYGKRLNRLFLELIDGDELANKISRLINYWRINRKNGDEPFGDFCNNRDFEELKGVAK